MAKTSAHNERGLIGPEAPSPEGGADVVGWVGHAAEPPRSAGSSVGFSLAGIWWQSRWWILGVAGLVSAVTIAAIWWSITPVYESSALLRISPKAMRIAFKNEENSSSSYYRSFVNTQVSLLRGVNVLQRVLDQQKVQATAWYNEPRSSFFRDPAPHLERLSKSTSVKAYRDSELIEVSVRAEKAGDAKLLANAIVDEYKKLSDETLREADSQRYETLVEEHNRLSKEIEGLIKTKFTVAKQLGTATPEELRSQLSTHLGKLEQDYADLERTLKLVEGDIQWLAQHDQQRTEPMGTDREASAGDPGSSQYSADVEWRRLRMSLEDAKHKLTLGLQDYGEVHPRIKQLRSEVEHAETLLHERETQLAEADGGELVPGRMLDRASLERQAERLRRQLGLLKEELDVQRGKVAVASDLAGDLAQYDEQIRRKRELYETLHARLTELELEGKAPARISIEAYAMEPSQPSGDRRLVFSVLVLAASLFLGFGVGYVRFVMDPRVREPADVRESASVPFLGQLPPLPTTDLVFEGATPFLLESIRMVRTAMLQRSGATGANVVLVTSTTSRTGKSSVAALLSQSLAALGKRTLLVEGDLRRPALGRRLGLTTETGLASLLCGKANVPDVVTSGAAPFDTVLAGDVPEDFDAERLSGEAFTQALAEWRKAYDFIILDSPPVLPVADARILGAVADGTIMVLRASHTRRTDVLQALLDLQSAGGRLLGTILVGTRFGSGYGYDADYYGQARVKAPKLPATVGAA